MILIGKTPPEKMRDLKNRVQRLADLCPENLRLSNQVEIIAVSKGQSKEKIMPLLESGHRVFGENRVQEASEKWHDLKAHYPDIVLHLIGALQTNKIDLALDLFDVIQTLDRSKLAHALKARRDEGKTLPSLMIQVNSGAEAQKSGVMPEDLDGFITECRALALPVKGLMCLPPVKENPAPYFAQLHQAARRNGLAQLSMGMSRDLEAALLLGATHIRPGRLVFGDRD